MIIHNFDPVLIDLGIFQIRWYSLSYILGILIGWMYANKIIKSTKCDAVKLEGGFKISKIIKHLVKNKIQVMGHLGILPQSTKGKFRSKGKDEKERKHLLKEAKILEEAGTFAIVLECIESSTANLITKSINNLFLIY